MRHIPGCSLKFIVKPSHPLREDIWSEVRILTKKTIILIGCMGCIWGVPGVYARYLSLLGVCVCVII
jgi:hypothetical protein